MYKYFICLLLFICIFSSCGKPNPNGYTGELIAITAKNPDDTPSLRYKWLVSEKPEESNLKLSDVILSEDESTLSFIPDIAGYYNFRVSVSWYGEVISIQSFPLEIGTNLQNSPKNKVDTPASSTSWTEEDNLWLEDSIKKPSTKPISKFKGIVEPELKSISPKNNENYYTVQVAAKKNLKSAEIFMKEMQGNGFGAYIQESYKENSKELWYRIRVGSFVTKDSAIIVADKIRDSMHLTSWIDYVRETKE